MSVQAPMKRVGIFAGQPLYYANAAFTQPGFHYWTGKENEFIGKTVKDVEDQANARRVSVSWALTGDGRQLVISTVLGEEGTNVFEGVPDSRQSERIDEPVSRFRPRYRALTEEEKALHDEIKTKASELLALYAKVPMRIPPHDHANLPASVSPRYLALATTDLESSVMWAVKALTLPNANQE